MSSFDTKNAYEMGYQAHNRGMGAGSNPYDPEVEVNYYEAWINGWVAAQQTSVAVVGC